ncbi:MAG: methyltransferase domain-containing protein [Chitinophagales bacterium]|nr:methyltransferase domain-containing protein [Chitinophagales bacterium]
MAKLHRNLVAAVVQGLQSILIEKKQADTTVEHLLQSNRSWGARDRHFISSNIYHIIRYKRQYEYMLKEDVSPKNLWKLVGAKLLTELGELRDWPEFETLNRNLALEHYHQAQHLPVIRESYPDWLYTLAKKEIGETWHQQAIALNQPAKLCVRVNTLKCSKGNLMSIFAKEGICFSETDLAPDALVIGQKINLKKHYTYQSGWFEVQDVSSQMVAPFTHVQPGMKVIDTCAGGGGKSLHLAALMQNKGQLLAADMNEQKLLQLPQRAKRNGCAIIKTHLISHDWLANQQHSADVVLIDAPCSGTGVLRRKPDAKWQLTPQFIDEVVAIQQNILQQYSQLLKTGGTMVYSTCSVLPLENQHQIQTFLARHPNFMLQEEKSIHPADSGFDGFYMARLVCN